METQKESFSFTYSAKEQEELKRIRQKYQPQEESKIDRIRRLDASVTKKASVVSLSVGMIGALVMGSGMSFIMTSLGESLGLQEPVGMVLGIVIGSIGLILLCCAYPIYNSIVRKERKKIAPEILRLTDELMK